MKCRSQDEPKSAPTEVSVMCTKSQEAFIRKAVRGSLCARSWIFPLKLTFHQGYCKSALSLARAAPRRQLEMSTDAIPERPYEIAFSISDARQLHRACEFFVECKSFPMDHSKDEVSTCFKVVRQSVTCAQTIALPEHLRRRRRVLQRTRLG